MKEHWNDIKLKRRYERIVRIAMSRDGFAREELRSPYLDELAQTSPNAKFAHAIGLAYTLGMLRSIASIDEGKTPVCAQTVTNTYLCDDSCAKYSDGPYCCGFCTRNPQIVAGECSEDTQNRSTDYYEPVTESTASADTLDEDEAPGSPNGALTVETLRAINKDMNNRRWVWIQNLVDSGHENKPSAYYRVSSDYTKGRSFCCGYPGYGVSFDYAAYGREWLAFWTQPENDASALL